MPDISRRASALGTENAFVVLAEVNALARQGKDIISFCIGQPDFPAPLHVQEAGIRAIREGKHGYTPSAGIDELREAAARYLGARRGGLPIRPEDVVIGAGAKPFIAYAILSTTDHGAGDEVIYPNPGFPIYESQIIACGAKPVPVQLREERDFAFDPAELEKLITPKTKLLILNYPHNPTGGLLSKKELEAIGKRLLPDLFGFVVRGPLLVMKPLGHTLRAIYLSGSIDPRSFYVQILLQPLFVPSEHVFFNVGWRLRGGSGGSDSWDADAPNLITELGAGLTREALPFLLRVELPQDTARAAASASASAARRASRSPSRSPVSMRPSCITDRRRPMRRRPRAARRPPRTKCPRKSRT